MVHSNKKYKNCLFNLEQIEESKKIIENTIQGIKWIEELCVSNSCKRQLKKCMYSYKSEHVFYSLYVITLYDYGFDILCTFCYDSDTNEINNLKIFKEEIKWLI